MSSAGGGGNSADLDAVLLAPFGALGLRCSADFLFEIRFLPPGTAPQPAQSRLATQACNALTDWLEDASTELQHLPLALRGTPYQQRVWAEIARIPCGQTRQYGELAQALGSAPRAIGQACRSNPFPLIVPCHRVLARHGLGGFAGDRGGHLLAAKRWLLAHEAGGHVA